ncbi:Translation initiation factor IF-2 [Frankliniella fusca]|uniref:Translation initiation factor IF-2 n=1 Tax=Frankliniella fusca TaxID=407009 RepID=A0AAE1LCP9_9NEOP|nr:Translation initiation factor IF-2 [Frankliniella fusca]
MKKKWAKNQREIQHHGKSIPMEYHDVPCTMESPMVFWDWVNRRRVGEMQFMLQKDYTKSKNNPPQEDSEAMKTLAPFELALMRTLQRVKIKDLQQAIDAIITLREEMKVPESNEFLFPALHSADGHF